VTNPIDLLNDPDTDFAKPEYKEMADFLGITVIELWIAFLASDTIVQPSDTAQALKLKTCTPPIGETNKLMSGIKDHRYIPSLTILATSLGILISHLGDFFARSAISSGFQALLDSSNRYRLSYFSLALRETAEAVFEKTSPNIEVKGTTWYEATLPGSQQKKQRPSWPDRLLFETVGNFDWETWVPNVNYKNIHRDIQKLRKKTDILSKYAHFKHDHFIQKQEEVIRIATEMSETLVEVRGTNKTQALKPVPERSRICIRPVN
jgi:hypothetical protein